MKRENVFEHDSPTLEMETQTLRPTQTGQPYVNGIPMNPYQASNINPSSAQYQQQQQQPFAFNGNPQPFTTNQFAPQIPQGYQPQPYPYPTNYFQSAPQFIPQGFPTPYQQPFNQPQNYNQNYQAPISQIPFNNYPNQPQFQQQPQQQYIQQPHQQYIQPQQQYFPQQQFNSPAQSQFTPAYARNGSPYLRNNERDFISWYPNVNILETDRAFKIEICVPGVTRENCRLNVDKNNILRVFGTRRWNQETDAVGFTRKDFNYGSFACSFILTETLQRDKITSSCRNGLLIINIPKHDQYESEDRSLSDISVN